MTLQLIFSVPMLIVSSWAFWRWRDPWSAFTAGFATCWAFGALFNLVFG